MRSCSHFLVCAVSILLLSGCGTVATSQWRNDALSRFTTALSAGAEEFAPEETDNIRQTISLADRYYGHEMIADADRLYQLSSQKCQLLYRNLVLRKTTAADTNSRQVEQGLQAVGNDVAGERISLEKTPRNLNAENSANVIEHTALPDTGISPPVVEQLTRSSVRRPKPVRKMERSRAVLTNPVEPIDVPYRTKPAGTTIYLTFDDGPSHLTLPIAEFLKNEGIQATFFVLGSNIKGREKAVTATLSMGHRVGNHTVSHNLQKLRASLITDSSEVKRAGAMIESLGGDGRMVRIPYGASGKTIISQVSAEGAQIFEWDINSNDSTLRGVRDHLFIERTVLAQLNRNSKKHVILLFHDGAGHESTLTALRDLVPRLKREGYRFGLLTRREKVANSIESRRALQ